MVMVVELGPMQGPISTEKLGSRLPQGTKFGGTEEEGVGARCPCWPLALPNTLVKPLPPLAAFCDQVSGSESCTVYQPGFKNMFTLFMTALFWLLDWGKGPRTLPFDSSSEMDTGEGGPTPLL